MESEIIVIGAGAAGIMAALIGARQGAKVLLIERNKSIGRKLLITGAGRCNLTNNADLNEIIAKIPGNGRFLYSAFQQFSNIDLMNFVENELHVPLKVERGQRVFPISDKAQDIVLAFTTLLQSSGVTVLTGTRVQHLLIENRQISGVVCENGRQIYAKKVIITTGGAAYPGTGSSGDGYKLASEVGHSIRTVFPSLVPLETMESWPKQVEGLTLNNITVTSYQGTKKLSSDFGDLLFTGFGVSGPTILSLSRNIVPLVLKESGSVKLSIDLKPALSIEELDRRVQRDFSKFINKFYKNALDELLPKSLIPVMIQLSEIDPLKPVHQITKEDRQKLIALFKGLNLTVLKPRSFSEAIVTGGGVTTKEISPKTMESKLVRGLYFAGEVVDVDGYTGGFNLQIAFSMGYVAGYHGAAADD